MKEMVRFLRFIARFYCPIEQNENSFRIMRPDGREGEWPAWLIREAASRGLAECRQGQIWATAEASSFIRRQLAATQEAHLDQHRVIEIREIEGADGPEPVRVNAVESPLAALARIRDKAGSPWFPKDAILAGERLARDFQFANLQPRVTQTYDPRVDNQRQGVTGGAADLKDNVIAARRRVAHAIRAMGPDLSGVALDVCCFEKGLELVERERQWPARSAKLMLRVALQHLHRHYNPETSARRAS